jgi:hypothetical protein
MRIASIGSVSQQHFSQQHFTPEFSKPAQPVVRIFCNSLITAVADHRRLS